MLLLEFILFLSAVFVCFYLPGRLICLRWKIQLTGVSALYFSTVLGLVVFTLVAYLFDSVKLFLLMPVCILVVCFLSLLQRNNILPGVTKKECISLIPILVMAFIFSLTMIFSGEYGKLLYLQGVNIKDAWWRLALINEMKAHFPPDIPGFAGIPLRGYHFFYDFLLAKLAQLFHFSTTDLYFHFSPILTALLWGLGVFYLVKTWTKSYTASLWAVFLCYFGGSFAFILPLLGHKGLSWDSAFGMLQPAVSDVNPEFSISIVIITAGLFSLLHYFKTRKMVWIVFLTLFFGVTAEFKIYAGIIALGAFTIFAFLKLLQKQFMYLVSLIGMGILFLLTYYRFTGKAGYLIWYPLWPQHSIFEDNFAFFNYGDKFRKYTLYYDIGRLLWLELEVFFIFLFGNIGTRVIGLPFLLKKENRKIIFSEFSLLVFLMMLVAFFTPMFFIQSIKVFETTQLFYYFLFFLSLFSAVGLSSIFLLLRNNIARIVFSVIFIAFTLPSAYIIYHDYLSGFTPSIPPSVQEALQFLRTQGKYDDTVLVAPPKTTLPTHDDIIYWYRNQNNLIVPALSDKRGYLNNDDHDFPGTDLEKRITLIMQLVQVEQSGQTNNLLNQLKQNHITFIYAQYRLYNVERVTHAKKIFENRDAIIYHIL